MSISVSRNPTDYEYDCEGHAGQELRDDELPIEAVDRCIERGEAKVGRANRVQFEGVWEGAVVTVVVNPKTRYIITAYRGTGKETSGTVTDRRDHKSPYRGAWE